MTGKKERPSWQTAGKPWTGWALTEILVIHGFTIPKWIGSSPPRWKMVVSGFGLRIMVGSGPLREYFPTFSNTTQPIGFTLWAKSMVGHGSMIIPPNQFVNVSVQKIKK